MTATHAVIGSPVGTQCDAAVYMRLEIHSAAGRDAIVGLFDELVARSETATLGRIKIFHWHVRHNYWRETSRIKARPLASVILPAATIRAVLDDVDRCTRALESYLYHGLYSPHPLSGTGVL